MYAMITSHIWFARTRLHDLISAYRLRNRSATIEVKSDADGDLVRVMRVRLGARVYDQTTSKLTPKVIGEGAYGVVYRIHGRGSQVALKWVRTEDRDTALRECIDTCAQFGTDSGVLRSRPLHLSVQDQAGLPVPRRALDGDRFVHRHPTAKMFSCFCVSELCVGDLRTLLEDASQTWTDDRLMGYAYSVLSALSVLMSRQYCHTDLKMSNVLITKNDTAVLGDVGSICAISVAHSNPCTFPSPRALIDEPEYTDVDVVWSIAILIIEMLYTVTCSYTHRNGLYTDLRHENLRNHTGCPHLRVDCLHNHSVRCAQQVADYPRLRALLKRCVDMSRTGECDLTLLHG
ncbi:hypothetical protein CYMTET_36993 [Cymbomonas tetramitiformis]|uniref:Protein kinase domain-containing protein n=2 Tax=Cymbomonas tetramitiformis TaxID=36881 RepID=A0AAE0EWY0_9CHLO|nr:hypothetical protein CYMTET_51402 [Cymbomonas tetramitiformis]KAK3243548.1 hypothetical protein CYMTET_46806 [Cymbomonas tetramitiformis]KAK3244324.1 hypothetical protein CYMTET_46053 [Cymbomonas tetramitiformis]KAK3253762.1 hypothetical protein CYMTET_36993 [Cymbomonas tetramitiformis]